LDKPNDMEHLKSQLGNAIIHICRDKLASKTGIRVQGLIGLTVDNAEVAIIQIDEYVVFKDSESTVSSATLCRMETSLPKQFSSPVSMANSLQPSDLSECQIRNVIGHVEFGRADEESGLGRQREAWSEELHCNVPAVNDSFTVPTSSYCYEVPDAIVKVEQPWCYESMQLSDAAQQSCAHVDNIQCTQATARPSLDQHTTEYISGLFNRRNSWASSLEDNTNLRDNGCSAMSNRSTSSGAYSLSDQKVISL